MTLFETNDLNLSGFLIAMGKTLSSSARDVRGIMTFSFTQDDQLVQLVEQYYSLNAQVNPQRFGSALKMLKNKLYQSHDINNNYGHERTRQTA